MVEQDIARSVAQHLVQRLPRRRRVERRVEQLLDPCGIQVFRRAIPGIAQGPDAALPSRAAAAARRSRTAISRVIVLHSAGALSRASFACHVPAAGDATSANQKYGGPPCRSRDLAATLSIGRDQRKLALERLLRGEDDAQRRALPRRHRRGQDRELGRVFAGADGPCACASTTENRKTKNAPAISNNAVTAAANWRAGNN